MQTTFFYTQYEVVVKPVASISCDNTTQIGPVPAEEVCTPCYTSTTFIRVYDQHVALSKILRIKTQFSGRAKWSPKHPPVLISLLHHTHTHVW
jgi:hypothetical protein